MKVKTVKKGSAEVELTLNDLKVIRRALDQLSVAGDAEAKQLLHEIDLIMRSSLHTQPPLP